MIEFDAGGVQARPRAVAPWALLAAVFFAAAVWGGSVWAQEFGPQPAMAAEADAAEAGPSDPTALADAALAPPAEQPVEEAEAASGPLPPQETARINWLEMIVKGGWLMVPIGLMSLLVVTFGIERLLALRRHKILPPELIAGLGKLASQKGGMDPRAAYRLCQQFPSTASNVIKIMLLKLGRPHTEVEHAVSEANDREAAKLYSNVRWLSLAAGTAPLLGLLGTVLGMIDAFFTTANLPGGVNKAEYLAGGIYTALVTTCAGLSVAIPAAFLAHLFEGRIQKLFRDLDEMLLGLLPQLERYEGRLRVSKEQFDTVPVELETDQPAVAAEPARKPAAAMPK
jgi:biopolymer transport protein ExbB